MAVIVFPMPQPSDLMGAIPRHAQIEIYPSRIYIYIYYIIYNIPQLYPCSIDTNTELLFASQHCPTNGPFWSYLDLRVQDFWSKNVKRLTENCDPKKVVLASGKDIPWAPFGVSWFLGFPNSCYPNSWILYFIENPKIKLMIWGYPHFRIPPCIYIYSHIV